MPPSSRPTRRRATLRRLARSRAGLRHPPSPGADRRTVGRQNVPRDQWLELGYECPRCGEQVTEADVYSWRPVPEDPKLLLIYCPNCGDRIEINHI